MPAMDAEVCGRAWRKFTGRWISRPIRGSCCCALGVVGADRPVFVCGSDLNKQRL